MDNPSDLQTELAAVRRQLAEATATAAAHKKQLSDAKAKAKAIIQRKMDEADAKVAILEDQNKLQAEELSTIKPMLRQFDDQRNAFSETCKHLENQLRLLQSENTSLQSRCSSLQADLTDARESASQLASVVQEEAVELQREVHSLRAELQHLNQSQHLTESNDSKHKSVSNGTDVSETEKQFEDPKQTVQQLGVEHDRSRATNQSLQDGAHARPKESKRESNDSPWKELRESEERVQVLTQKLEEAASDAERKKTEYANAISEAEAERLSLKEEITTTKDRIHVLLQDLQTRELALQEEREKTIQQQRSKAEVTAQEGDEQNKILEAKVSEMERVVASKQAEIGKVREKAKTYLRELNAEKRAMETKMKEEVESLQKHLEEERKMLQVAEQRTESASAEVDNCLALIRDKQKSVQVLKMTISTQKSAAEEAARESESLRDEFSRYKERARLALQGKDAESESIEAKIETATAALRRDLDTAQNESKSLKTRLRQFEEIRKRYDEVLDRAERAEAAADLLRKDATGVSTMSYSRVDMLEEQLSTVEAELSATRVAMEDAEAKLETTGMRLEAAEKAMHGAEVRAEEAERISQKIIDGQRSQVESLEKELVKAQESSASAQRTAAAAAKALSFSSAEIGEGNSKPNPEPATSADIELRDVRNVSSFGGPSPVKAGRSTLAAAIEGHSDGFTLRASFDSQSSSSLVLDSELKMKDQQIFVLTSQIAELGALLEDVQRESELRSEQTSLLKEEVKNLDSKLAAAEKLQNGAPFRYLRTIVVRYLETDDSTLLPVIANILSFTEEENARVKKRRWTKTVTSASPKGGYFGLNSLLGRR